MEYIQRVHTFNGSSIYPFSIFERRIIDGSVKMKDCIVTATVSLDKHSVGKQEYVFCIPKNILNF